MTKLCSLLVVFFYLSLSSFAQSKDDNIIISERTENYTYTISGSQVIVKESTETVYYSSKRTGRITIQEMYDNESSIENVKVKGVKGIKPDYFQYSSNNIFYSDAKICQLEIPFDNIGKSITVQFEKTYKDPRYFTSIYLSEPSFVKKKTVNIVVPSWMNAEFIAYNFGDNVSHAVNTDPKMQTSTYTYVIENESAMKSESRMQGRSHIFPHLLVLNKSALINGEKQTYFESLDEQYKWYKQIASLVKNDDAVIAEKARDITKDCRTDLEKIKTIYAWVQDNIRYLAFEDGIAGFKPDDAHEVLRKKYGDCKGMANLLKAFLQAEGFDARLTWIGTNHIKYDYSTPSLAVDNHMICALYYADELYFLDATVEYMPLGEYPSTIQGRQALIENADAYVLTQVPVFTPRLNTDSTYCEFTLHDQVLEGKVMRTFHGESKQVLLSLIHSTPKDKLDAALKSFVESGNVQDRATNIQLTGQTPDAESTTIQYDIAKRSGVQKLDNDYYLDINSFKDFINYNFDIEERKYDYLMPYKHHVVRELVLNIPQDYVATHIPEDFVLLTDNYGFSITYQVMDGRIVLKSEITIYNPLIKRVDFPTWNTHIAALKKNYLEQIILSRTTNN